MKCETIRALLLDDIDSPQSEDVLAHLDTCTDCRGYFAQITLLDQRLRHHAEYLAVPTVAWQRLQASIAAQPENEVIYLDPPLESSIIESLKSIFVQGALRRNPALLRAFSGAVLIAMAVLFLVLVIPPRSAAPGVSEAATALYVTNTPTPRFADVSVTAVPLRFGLVIDAVTLENDELNEFVELCADDSFNELTVAGSAALNLYEKLTYAGYKVDLLERDDPELPVYDGDAMLILQTRSCNEGEESGYSIIWNEPADDELVNCMIEQYGQATGLDSANPRRPVVDIELMVPEVPALVIELGALSADREFLRTGDAQIAEGLMAGMECYVESLGWLDDSIAHLYPRTATPTAVGAHGRVTYSYNAGSNHGLYLYALNENADDLVWSDPDWYPIEAEWRLYDSHIVWSGYRVVDSPLNLDLYTLGSTDGTNFELINPVVTPLVSLPGNDINPAWSPDGTMVAFASDVDDDRTDTNYEIFIVTVADGAIRRVTYDEADDTDPAWSPDGLWLVYASSTETLKSDLYLTRADGTEGPFRVTTTPDLMELTPDWSPDGHSILYSATETGREGGIYTLSLDDVAASPTLILETEWAVNEAVWSPDGLMIAFIDLHEGTVGTLYVMNADGTAIRRITEWRGGVLSPGWLP